MPNYLIPPNGPCNTLGMGVFDGIHLGHQAITKQCDTVLSFHPLPNLILDPNSDIQYITTPKERQHILPSIIVLEFSKELSQLSATDFLEQVVAPLSPKKIIVGYDFKFGYKQEGSTDFLRNWCQQQNIAFQTVEPVKSDTDIIYKSSLVRKALRSDPNHAIELMGHPYVIIGKVIRGDNRGKELGYPTANIEMDPKKVYPKPGVYKGSAIVEGTRYKAGIYIGHRHTFDKTELSCEAHLLNFNQDLYNQDLTLEIESFIRDDMSFDSKEALQGQIKKDLQAINT